MQPGSISFPVAVVHALFGSASSILVDVSPTCRCYCLHDFMCARLSHLGGESQGKSRETLMLSAS